jgi:hypothetical protein
MNKLGIFAAHLYDRPCPGLKLTGKGGLSEDLIHESCAKDFRNLLPAAPGNACRPDPGFGKLHKKPFKLFCERTRRITLDPGVPFVPYTAGTIEEGCFYSYRTEIDAEEEMRLHALSLVLFRWREQSVGQTRTIIIIVRMLRRVNELNFQAKICTFLVNDSDQNR